MNTHKSVINLALFTILSRFVGFLRVLAVGALLGTTLIGNTFQSTNSISNVLFDLLVSGALSAALIPQLTVALHKGKNEFNEIVSSLLTVVLIILGVITIFGFIFAHEISTLLFNKAPEEYKADQIRVGTTLIRFFIPQVFFYGIGAISVAALSAKKIFAPAAYAPILGSLILVVGLGIFRLQSSNVSGEVSTRSTVILGLTGTLACIGFVATPLFIAIKNNISFKPSTDFRLGFNSLKTSIPAIAIQASAAIILAVSIYLGNKTVGAVVAYQIGFIFFFTPYAIISGSFSTVVLPEISLQAASLKEAKQNEMFKENIKKTLSWTYIPLSLISAFVVSIAIPISHIISVGEARNGSKLFEQILIFMFIGLVPYGVFQSCSRIFFAKSNVKTPALVVLVTSLVISGVGLLIAKTFTSLSIVVIMGLIHTIAYAIAGIILLIILKSNGLNVMPSRSSGLCIMVSIIFGIFGYLLSRIINPTSMISSIMYICILLLGLGFVVLLTTPKTKLIDIKNMILKRKVSNV